MGGLHPGWVATQCDVATYIVNFNTQSKRQFLSKEKIMDIKVLGTGCANCKATIALIIQVTQDKGLQAEVSKVEDL
ncbi:thioredoxin family protein, partial [Pseudomonas aeruginosa]